MINCGAYVAAYSGLSNITVKQGDAVKKGQQIANPVFVTKEYYIHFEINDFMAEKLRCPLDYIDATFKAELEKMHSKDHYPEKGAEPLLCNCQELPYKTTMKTGP
jgi:murein DD-endopeptidase MepM/ murein hydrolase activator NlpD